MRVLIPILSVNNNMERIVSSIAILSFILFSQLGHAEGIDFFKGTYQEAFAQAEEEGKLVFVDAYAEWCGPCKRMAATTFKDAQVGEFFNKQFINLKIDMEKGQGLTFRDEYPVSAFPTLLFIDGSGKVVHKEVGGKKTDDFLKLAQLALRKHDNSDKYAKLYEEGNRDFDLMMKYVKALNKAEKPSLKVSNEYVRSEPSISDQQMAEFLFEATTHADSRLFDMMVDHKSQIIELKGKEALADKVEEACCKTVEKAIEYESPELLTSAKEKIKKNAKSKYKSFDVKSDMDYYLGTGDTESYLKKTKEYVQKIIKKDPEKLNKVAQELVTEFKTNKDALSIAGETMKKSIKLRDSSESRLTYATILIHADQNAEALKQANQALEIAKDNGEPVKKIQGVIQYLKSS